MTRAALLAFRPITKEIRALSLAFLTCLVAMVAAGVFSRLRGFLIPTYFLGAAALGALSIGHEYSHRTLALLLSQPARRQRVLLVKLGVLAAMLVAIGAVAWAVMRGDSHFPESQRLAIGLLPLLCGLSVAPWLTMACRSPIAGTVFTIALPGVMLTVSDLVYVAIYGPGPAADFEMAVLWRGTLGLCAIGAVMSWRMFMRLEAIDGGGPDVHLPQWLRWGATPSIGAPALTKRPRVWLLVKKELRLQQMAFAVAGLYLLGWLTLVSLRARVPAVDDVFSGLTFFYGALISFYGALISMLIGSLASAEERQLGTLEWQLLLPVAIWKQWAVKAGTAVGLALLLALGVPALLASINPALDLERFLQPQLAAGVALLTVGSLYVSSLSTSGLRALLVSLPALIGAALFLQFLAEYPGSAVFRGLRGTVPVPPIQVSLRVVTVLEPILTGGLLALMLRFALTNHRSADRTADRVLKQLLWMAGCLTVGVIGVAGVAAFVRPRLPWWWW